jgi:hypothetical protein
VAIVSRINTCLPAHGSWDYGSHMGFARTNWRGLRMAFIMSLFLVEFGPTRQPLFFVIGYVDTALLLFVLWLLYKFAGTILGLVGDGLSHRQ